jgi:hypothetical protein
MRSIHAIFLATLLALAACDPGGTDPPAAEGGDFNAVLTSPNGAEGAASLELTGGGIQSVSATGAVLVSSAMSGGRRVVIVKEPAGSIEFRVSIAPGNDVPDVRVVEVVDGQDQPRGSLNGYHVQFSRVSNTID